MRVETQSGLNASTNISIYNDYSKDMSFKGFFSQNPSDYLELGLKQDFSTGLQDLFGFETFDIKPKFKQIKDDFGKLKKEMKELKEQIKVSNILKRELLFVDDLPLITPYKKDYIYQLIHKGEIPVHYREGKKGKPVFLRSEIEHWLTEHKVKSKYCIEQEAIAYVNNK